MDISTIICLLLNIKNSNFMAFFSIVLYICSNIHLEFVKAPFLLLSSKICNVFLRYIINCKTYIIMTYSMTMWSFTVVNIPIQYNHNKYNNRILSIDIKVGNLTEAAHCIRSHGSCRRETGTFVVDASLTQLAQPYTVLSV